jgi:hypothetical protein
MTQINTLILMIRPNKLPLMVLVSARTTFPTRTFFIFRKWRENAFFKEAREE